MTRGRASPSHEMQHSKEEGKKEGSCGFSQEGNKRNKVELWCIIGCLHVYFVRWENFLTKYLAGKVILEMCKYFAAQHRLMVQFQVWHCRYNLEC